MPIKVCHIVGARPNFVKAAPVVRALACFSEVHQVVVHTGQHYDFIMSEVFFRELQIPKPDFNLQIGSGTHAQQTAATLTGVEGVIARINPDVVVVYGDVNSTVAAALVCAKVGVKVAHVEAGLRSFDRTMPEEINRLLTDQISDLLFTPSEDGNANLIREGVAPQRIHMVGNVMIDTLVDALPKCDSDRADLPRRYALVTMHRPANVDDSSWMAQFLCTLHELSSEIPVVFPVHPRTRKGLADVLTNYPPGGDIRFLDPQAYLPFLALQAGAEVVITDSGGIQEETTFLRVPCLTVRENTERPITVELGTNVLVGRDLRRLRDEVGLILRGKRKKGTVPPLWDGHASERIAAILVAHFGAAEPTPVSVEA